jgi:hypothetical protein
MKPSGRKPPAMADGIKFDPDDIQALIEWLQGRIRKRSPRELQARRMLALMFRTRTINVDGWLCRILADAVDPDRENVVQVSLKRGKPGRPQRIEDYHIAVFVCEERKRLRKHKLAVEEAMTKFGVSRGKVDGAWKKWRSYIEENSKLYARI